MIMLLFAKLLSTQNSTVNCYVCSLLFVFVLLCTFAVSGVTIPNSVVTIYVHCTLSQTCALFIFE